MKHCLVTGGSRGIGLEFTRQYLAKGYQVYAASRNPSDSDGLLRLKAQYDGHLVIMRLDVGDEPSRRECIRALAEHTGKLDLLINSAGILSGNEEFCRPLGELDQDELSRTFLINSIAPLMLVEAALSLLRRGEQPVVANISSDNGSITSKSHGGKYGYSASKAALNMVTRILSVDLRAHGIIVISLHPGWVKTTMTRHEDAPLEPSDSIGGMIQILDSLDMNDTGSFIDWRGRPIPW
jgi:NAD(P)-dependent dehydrogenase (short-subunit alcohol dehydrogenase family)